ncbi:hypothetical protein Tsubulata_015590 [Turnera subulata]|uniref:Cyclase family protein n=1 Tax=Turnera subulata TaxID=218843 RepID=A0A9Q0FFW2_9ROSI|nr:hypothetical protein Tsubulata_015590 [Turnera subulata]
MDLDLTIVTRRFSVDGAVASSDDMNTSILMCQDLCCSLMCQEIATLLICVGYITCMSICFIVIEWDLERNASLIIIRSADIHLNIHVCVRHFVDGRRLMFKKEFDSSFVGFKADGAKWLVENTDIKLVGVDYLSVAAYTDSKPTHLIFLKSRVKAILQEIILVEGLKLDGVKAGAYNLHCLPLRLHGAEGSPARCILIK